MSLSKVHLNQGGANRFFMISEVNPLFYIIRRNPPHKTWQKTCTPKQCISEE